MAVESGEEIPEVVAECSSSKVKASDTKEKQPVQEVDVKNIEGLVRISKILYSSSEIRRN